MNTPQQCNLELNIKKIKRDIGYEVQKRLCNLNIRNKTFAKQTKGCLGLSVSGAQNYIGKVINGQIDLQPNERVGLRHLERYSLLLQQLDFHPQNDLIVQIAKAYPQFTYPPQIQTLDKVTTTIYQKGSESHRLERKIYLLIREDRNLVERVVDRIIESYEK